MDFGSFFRGEQLIRIMSKQMTFILTIFITVICLIIWNMKVEEEMVKSENLLEEVENLKIQYTHKNIELISLNKRTTIEEMLERSGSTLKAPVKPAQIVDIE